MLPPIPSSWTRVLNTQTDSGTYRELDSFLDREVAEGWTILPPPQDIFRALEVTPYDSVKVVLLGQDPYHTPGIAHGLSFSVPPHIQPVPPSLKNIYRELSTDVGCRMPNNGYLEPWARQGVLLLNAVWTVRAHQPNSHRGRGWEFLTNRIIEAIDAKPTRVVFVLWGQEAKKKHALITNVHHIVLTAAHPSPLSARKFFGCRCFSQVNQALIEKSLTPIDWQIPDRD
jgi:uracil-DNA glycosylase